MHADRHSSITSPTFPLSLSPSLPSHTHTHTLSLSLLPPSLPLSPPRTYSVLLLTLCLCFTLAALLNAPDSHMSTIAELGNGVLAAAFQGSGISEGCNDQSIFFTTSTDNGTTWSPPVIALNDSYANWGPVLYFNSEDDTLWMFHSVSTQYDKRDDPGCGAFGKSYPGGEVRYVTSTDHGKTWSKPVVILTFQARGQVSKVTANVLLVTSTGRWMLPFWQVGFLDSWLLMCARACVRACVFV